MPSSARWTIPKSAARAGCPNPFRTTIEKASSTSKKRLPPVVLAEPKAEIYAAPRAPLHGRIIGLDCHPDTCTAAVFRGTTPHDARKLCTRDQLSLSSLLSWVGTEFSREDLF